MRNSLRLFVGLIVVSLFLTVIAGAADISKLEGLIGQFPADNVETEYKIEGEIMSLGAEGIESLCRMLKPPSEGGDVKARYALHGLAVYTSREGAVQEKKIYAQSLCNALTRDVDKEIKAFLIEQLTIAGTDESVATLSEFLTDERLCRPAAQALESIGGEGAGEALTDALEATEGGNRAAIIKSLGELGYKKAGRQISRYTSSEDRDEKLISIWALANMGDTRVESTLEKAMKGDSKYERSLYSEYYLLLAKRLGEEGRERNCSKMCRQLIKSAQEWGQSHIACGALSTMVDILGEKATDDLLEAGKSGDWQLSAAAVKLSEQMNNMSITRMWVKNIGQLRPEVKVKVLDMLGRVGDESAKRVIYDSFGDEDKAVRFAAAEAAVVLDGEGAVESLLKKLTETKEADEIKQTAEILMRVPGDGVLKATAEALDKMSATVKVALIDGLAARKAKAYSGAVFAQTEDSDSSVRSAAIKALDDLAAPEDVERLIALVLKAQGGSEKNAAQKALVAAAEQIDDKEKRTEAIIEAINTSSGQSKADLIRVVGKIGGKAALETAVAATKAEDETVKDAAIRAIVDWPDSSGIDEIVKIACNKDELKYQVLAVRGLGSMLKEASIDSQKKVDICRKVLGSLDRPEDKRLVISALGDVRNTWSLETVAEYLEDDNLKNAAALSAVKIAVPQDGNDKGLGGYETGKILKKAVGLIDSEQLRTSANEYLKRLPEKLDISKEIPAGFTEAFNGKDLTGIKGVLLPPYDNPVKRMELSDEQFTELQTKADEHMREHWYVEDGVLVFDGKGFSVSLGDFGDFEMYVDWMIGPRGDSGIYLRGTPQVQIWDPEQWNIGSGGLYNNQKNPSKPSMIADNPTGEWNTFYIKMVGENVTVKLNDKLIVDNVVLENYWDRSRPIFDVGPVELQCHGHKIYFDNIFIREIPRAGEESKKQEEGWISIFNGEDLTGWKRHENLPGHGIAGKWYVEDGAIVGVQDPPGKGGFLTTLKSYKDFEIKLETKIDWPFDSGVFLRTGADGKSHQVNLDYRPEGQIGKIYLPWTQGGVHECPEGIKYFKKDEWNELRIRCTGEPANIKVWLNDTLITDFQHTAETTKGVPTEGGISLQVHPGGEGYDTSKARFRNIFVREIIQDDSFVSLFNGKDLTGWVGDTKGYVVEDGAIVCRPGGNLYTEAEYSDFHLKFEFKLTPGANNGLGIRAPLSGDAAYAGMELQILDNKADKYANLQPYQYHGSIYGVVPAKRGFQRPIGEWNHEEVIATGNKIKVILNDTVIVDADITDAIENGTMDHREHPGLKNKSGHIGYLGHGDVVYFRNIFIKDLSR